jgi:hypothetical protein
MKKNKHFRRIPDYIDQEVARIQSQYVIVAAIVDVTKTDIADGRFRHFGIHMNEGNAEVPEVISPDMMNGVYARRNRDGIVWKLKALPMVTKTYWWESPNFGDPTKGYHSNYRDIKVYQRQLEPPRDWEIILSILREDDSRLRIKAEIATILDRQDNYFKKDLFFAINLLQEQFQDCHVFDTSTTDKDIAKITSVGWEIFPPGTLDRTLAVITGKMRTRNPTRQREIQNRAEALSRLNPSEYIVGSGMNSRYFGAKFDESIVVFENVDYGNALYILFDNWQEISQMSRIDILKRHEKDFIRIIHKNGWEKTLLHYINELKHN